MLGSKKQDYKDKLIRKITKMIDKANDRYLEAGRSQPSTDHGELNKLSCELIGMIKVRDELKLIHKPGSILK